MRAEGCRPPRAAHVPPTSPPRISTRGPPARPPLQTLLPSRPTRRATWTTTLSSSQWVRGANVPGLSGWVGKEPTRPDCSSELVTVGEQSSGITAHPCWSGRTSAGAASCRRNQSRLRLAASPAGLSNVLTACCGVGYTGGCRGAAGQQRLCAARSTLRRAVPGPPTQHTPLAPHLPRLVHFQPDAVLHAHGHRQRADGRHHRGCGAAARDSACSACGAEQRAPAESSARRRRPTAPRCPAPNRPAPCSGRAGDFHGPFQRAAGSRMAGGLDCCCAPAPAAHPHGRARPRTRFPDTRPSRLLTPRTCRCSPTCHASSLEG